MSVGQETAFVRDEQPLVISLPRFARTMKGLSVGLAAVWALEVLMASSPRFAPDGDTLGFFHYLALIPARVVFQHQLWRLVSYPFLHSTDSISSLLGTVLSLWLFGSPLERLWGPRRLLTLMGLAAFFGGLFVVAAGQLSLVIMNGRTLGMLAPSSALVMAWSVLNLRESLSFFGLFNLTGRQFAWITVLLAGLGLALTPTGGDVASIVGLGKKK